jgi:hypothetical protein
MVNCVSTNAASRGPEPGSCRLSLSYLALNKLPRLWEAATAALHSAVPPGPLMVS